jgi:hypothetical protein
MPCAGVISARGSIFRTDNGALLLQCSALASQAIKQLVSSMPDWSMAEAGPGNASSRTIAATPRNIACIDLLLSANADDTVSPRFCTSRRGRAAPGTGSHPRRQRKMTTKSRLRPGGGSWSHGYELFVIERRLRCGDRRVRRPEAVRELREGGEALGDQRSGRKLR